MTRLLDGSIDPAASPEVRSKAIQELLNSSFFEVDEALLKLLRSAYDNSGK